MWNALRQAKSVYPCSFLRRGRTIAFGASSADGEPAKMLGTGLKGVLFDRDAADPLRVEVLLIDRKA